MTDLKAKQEFASALVAFQAEVPVVGKDQTATVKSDKGQYSYSFADLTKITDKAFPLLSKHGFAFSTVTDVRNGEFGLACELMHIGGHSKEGFFPLPKGTTQQIGSGITYARRYNLCAMTGIAPGGEDDDGQRASEAPAARSQQPDPLRVAVDRVRTAAHRLGWDEETLTNDYAAEHGGEFIRSATVEQLNEYAVRLEVSTPDVVAS